MAVQTRSNPAKAAPGSVVNPAANLARELITARQVFDWTLQGKCFTASIPVETDSIDGIAASEDLAHTFMLSSDRGGSKIVVPICTQIMMHTNDGTGIVYVDVSVIRSANDVATLRTISGTSMNITNNRSDLHGNHTATALYTATSSALDGTTDWLRIKHYTCQSGQDGDRDNAANANTVIINHLQDEAPLVLYKLGSLTVQAIGATTDPTVRCVFQWAELDVADYLP